ncbi:MAG TPA: penicillin-binding protein [Candidatus Binataceae bacterium]|nr:penicillin-binding protein [Candidatus Binataceae bacterium]
MNAAFQRRRARIGALTAILASLFALAALRLAFLVVSYGPRLNSLGRSEQTGETRLAAVRGPIVDRKGEALALSAEMRSVYAHPHKLLNSTTAAERAKLAVALGMAPAELEHALARPDSHFIWLARQIAPERAQAAEALGIDALGVISEYKRFYPERSLAGAALGAAGTDGQGLSGLELEYDRVVRGAPLELSFYHDALGHPILDSPLALEAPTPGAQLELTIDASIQSLAENALTDQVQQAGAKRGVAIVLDPFTGEVIALANVGDGAAADRLHNAAVQDAFEPGSTMKGLLASIALADRAITPDTRFFCEQGKWKVDGRTIHDDSPHGALDLGGILEVSSNIGAAKIALTLGAQRFYAGLRAFGLGSPTGIDLPGEAPGLLRRPGRWREIDLANHGFGQGIAVTPIQLAAAYAAIANGGLMVRPHVVAAAYDASGGVILRHAPQVMGRAIEPEIAHEMNLLLRNVVDGAEGTGRRAQVDGFEVAGKTGTAQMVNPAGGYFQNRHVCSFVGFLPADDPRLLILVVLYDVGRAHFGGLYAAPVFSQIASGAMRDLNVAPTHPDYEVASLLPGAGGDSSDARETALDPDAEIPPLTGASTPATPSFAGLSLRRALQAAAKLGVNPDVRGSGYVVAQEPAPGAALATHIRLTLSPVGPVAASRIARRLAQHEGARR